MSSILDIINVPIGYLFRWLYLLVKDYGVAIILIAVVTKLLMLPLGIKQQKSTLSQMKFRPRIAAIQQKYRDNPERMQQEMKKLQEEGYSPAAGCSTLLIQFPILIGIYNVIRHPLKYIIGLSNDAINGILAIMNKVPGFESLTTNNTEFEITALKYIKENSGQFTEIINSSSQMNLIENFRLEFLGMPQFDLSKVPETIINPLRMLPIPKFNSWIVIIPILSGLTAILLTIINQKLGPQNYMQDEATQKANGAMKFMLFLTPYMSYAIAMSVPAGLGLYWIASNLLMILQTILLNKFYNPAEYMKKYEAEEAARKEKRKKAQEIIAAEKREERLALEEAKKAGKKKGGNNSYKSADSSGNIPGDKENIPEKVEGVVVDAEDTPDK